MNQMDLQSMMETLAEAWVAASTTTPLTEAVDAHVDTGRTSVSIPIHCIVERISSPGSGSSGSGGATTQSTPPSVTISTPTTNTSSTADASSSSVNCSSAVIEHDSYAILPSQVLFTDLVRTALTRLGYSPSEIVGAKGVISLRNWKPLTFDQITDNPESTIGDILSDIASVATLRIRLFRPRMNAAHELKDKLLQVLLAHSYNLLVNSECPIDQQILTGLCRGRVDHEINEETRRSFDQWYLQQVFNHYRQIAITAQQTQQQQQSIRRTPTHPLLVDMNSDHMHVSAAAGSNGGGHRNSPDKHPALMSISPSLTQQQPQHHLTSVRTRIRTSFDPELELPKLHRWFSENRHPSRAQVQEYVKELNSLESRKGRKPLDINNVVYWFKNARAAHKRAELKYVGSDGTNTNMTNGSHSPGGKGYDNGNKCNEESTRNGSDDYYSNDDDCESSRDAPQTLDLSMRPHKRARSESPASNDFSMNSFAIKMEEETHSDTNNTNNPLTIKDEPQERNDASSECNSFDGDDSDEDDNDNDDTEKEYFEHTNTFQNNSNNVNSNCSISNNKSSTLPDSPEGRRIRRSRTFIDPMSEVPRLEHWFSLNTHPAHSQIVRYTDELNSLQYRQKFPKLEPKNIQFWFKNRRAKYKRLTLPSQIHQPSTVTSLAPSSSSSSLNVERLIAH